MSMVWYLDVIADKSLNSRLINVCVCVTLVFVVVVFYENNQQQQQCGILIP